MFRKEVEGHRRLWKEGDSDRKAPEAEEGHRRSWKEGDYGRRVPEEDGRQESRGGM